jgi:hypothetical protein
MSIATIASPIAASLAADTRTGRLRVAPASTRSVATDGSILIPAGQMSLTS